MAKPVIIVTNPDGKKKVIVGKSSNMIPVKTIEVKDKDKRAKPLMSKAGLTNTKTAYKCGGKINVRKR